MHSWMTRRHEGYVSTMLTESDLSIALQVRRFKGSVRRNGGASRQARFWGLYVLTTVDNV